MAAVNFYAGSKAAYTALTSKDSAGLYILTNGEIYKGTQRIAFGVTKVNALPDVAEAAQDVLYVLPTGEASVYDGTSFTTVVYATVGAIESTTAGTSIPNVTAVNAAIQAAIAALPETLTADDISLNKNADGKLQIKGFSTASDAQQMRVVVSDTGVRSLEFFTPEISDADIKTQLTDLGTSITNLTDQYTALNNAYTTLDTQVTNMEASVEGKADKATTLAGYGITDAYTKTETDALLGNVQSNIIYKGTVANKTDLPTAPTAQAGDVYQVTEGEGAPKWYIYNGETGEWDEKTDTSVDVSIFATKEELANVKKTTDSIPSTITSEVTFAPMDETDGLDITVGTAARNQDGSYGDVASSTMNIPIATQSSAGLMSAADKAKLDSGAAGGGYTLPPASATVLGGIKTDGATTETTTAGVLSVTKVPSALTVGDKTFNGSAAVTIEASDLGVYTAEETDKKIQEAASQATIEWNNI